MLAFSNDYYGMIFRATQSVELFCAYDYSFWSREMRNEYISLLKKYDIEPKMYYIKTPKEVCMERIRKRNGNHQNDIILTEQTASTYYDHFQPPTDEEGEVIVVEGY